jgi:hemoglobin
MLYPCNEVQVSFEETINMTTLLFDRLGGKEGITAIVDGVVEAHMCNPEVSARFLPYRDEPEKLAVIKKHTVDFFSAGSGAAVTYSGRDMVSTHKGMNITAPNTCTLLTTYWEC